MAALAWVAVLVLVPHAAGVSLRWPLPQKVVTGPSNNPADSSVWSEDSSLFGGAAAAADRVARLPGQPPGVPESQLYAGMLLRGAQRRACALRHKWLLFLS